MSFTAKLAAHRSNRLSETFGPVNISSESRSKFKKTVTDESLVPLPYKTPSNNSNSNSYSSTKTLFFSLARVQIYENSCQTLDTTIDWQIRGLLADNTIVLSDRSFSFNDVRAFATALQSNLESLTLHSVGLTGRSVSVLCQGLQKCVRLTLLVKLHNQIIDLLLFVFF